MVTPPYQGLASHGAMVGIVTALIFYARSHKDQPFLWVADRIVITVSLSGFFIRMGNLMNHEIVGKEIDYNAYTCSTQCHTFLSRFLYSCLGFYCCFCIACIHVGRIVFHYLPQN
jgi:prolipoprotein diacylglyceryltransferase